jgi:hypothetical protein
MVRRELMLHAIAYNLVRRIMLAPAAATGAPLDRMSFKGTLDTLRQWQGSFGNEQELDHRRSRRRAATRNPSARPSGGDCAGDT